MKCDAIFCTREAKYIVKLKKSKYMGRVRCEQCAREFQQYGTYGEIELIPIKEKEQG